MNQALNREKPMQTLPILIFDGDCGICTSWANWVSRHWTIEEPTILAWQKLDTGGLAQLGLSMTDVTSAAWWVDSHRKLFGADLAIGQALRACGYPWRLVGIMLLTLPVRWFGKCWYPLLARYRHRLPGGTPACRIDHHN